MPAPSATPLPDTGPYLTMAVFCEKVMVEQGGGVSVIRMTDTLNRTESGPEPPTEMPPFITDELTLIIVLRAGQAKGRFGIKIEPEAPSGLRLPAVEQGIQLVGGPWGASIVSPIQIEITDEGVYWFDVILRLTLRAVSPRPIPGGEGAAVQVWWRKSRGAPLPDETAAR